MSAAAKGLWALIVLVVLILGAAFVLPLLVHLLVELPQWGWEAIS
jgi:hypothetical protein